MTVITLSLAAVWGQYAFAADDMSGMDHSQMNQVKVAATDSMAGMDMSGGADAPKMQGGFAPANARDPHAYSGGYDFGPIARPVMADEHVRAGLMINRIERVKTKGDTYFSAYDMQGWIGKDYDKLVVKAEGEVAEGKIHEARTELLWSHAISTFWDAQVGVRNDSGIDPSRNWLAAGVQGLAPYWFEVDATVYAGDQGRTALRLSGEYELLLTQKLILQPRVEASFYGMKDAERGIGSGLNSVVTGLRLRYEIRREFAPYIGMDWISKFGETADYATAAGGNTHEANVVAGLRMWF
ncbi:MAG: copper resistance protein CopB [Gallionellales bacterium 35-53-114]|nr:MAG: copper resistance protein CopB [Gallionellales bacterium 35-53-114]OYZ64987.1 MAG: copper resistance protein CopB [Gallionellales bacterium 24-53-125]OZB07830.1 MAG: copper resistance protein CopB [Gallionellales bacterium 39-52-133]